MKKSGLSQETLKIIACVTMLIDHIGAAVLARLLMVNGLGVAVFCNAIRWDLLPVFCHADHWPGGVSDLLLSAG